MHQLPVDSRLQSTHAAVGRHLPDNLARTALPLGRQVLRVRCCPLELCGSTSLPDPEQLQEYGQLVPPQGPGSEWSAPAEPFDMDTAYVYVLTK